jgi:hypothetical protein
MVESVTVFDCADLGYEAATSSRLSSQAASLLGVSSRICGSPDETNCDDPDLQEGTSQRGSNAESCLRIDQSGLPSPCGPLARSDISLDLSQASTTMISPRSPDSPQAGVSLRNKSFSRLQMDTWSRSGDEDECGLDHVGHFGIDFFH